MNRQLTSPMHWSRYFRDGAFIIALLVVSLQPAFTAAKPDDASTSKSGSKSAGGGETGPDVLGLRIGMTPDETRAIFKSRGFGTSSCRVDSTSTNCSSRSPNRPIDDYVESSATLAFMLPGGNPQTVPNTKYLLTIHGLIRDLEKDPRAPWVDHGLTVVFGPVPGQEGIVSLQRVEGIQPNKQPTVDAFEKSLVEKYGTPTEKPSDTIYRWRYDSNGTLRKPAPSTSFVDCPLEDQDVVNINWYLEQLAAIQELKQKAEKGRFHPAGCGAIFVQVVLVVDAFKLVNFYSTRMMGFDATIQALDAAKAIIEKAQADARGTAIKKGQQQKPDL